MMYYNSYACSEGRHSVCSESAQCVCSCHCDEPDLPDYCCQKCRNVLTAADIVAASMKSHRYQAPMRATDKQVCIMCGQSEDKHVPREPTMVGNCVRCHRVVEWSTLSDSEEGPICTIKCVDRPDHGYVAGKRCDGDCCPDCGAPNQWSVVQTGGYVVFTCGSAYDGERTRRKGDACDLIRHQRLELEQLRDTESNLVTCHVCNGSGIGYGGAGTCGKCGGEGATNAPFGEGRDSPLKGTHPDKRYTLKVCPRVQCQNEWLRMDRANDVLNDKIGQLYELYGNAADERDEKHTRWMEQRARAEEAEAELEALKRTINGE